MRINNKGFLMAETIVTVCIIATLATSMYLYVSSSANKFEERNNYENVVDIYKLNTIKEYLEITDKIDSLSTDAIDLEVFGNEENLNVKYVFLIGNKQSNIDIIKSKTSTPQSLKDYLNWLPLDGNESDKRLIAMFNSTGNGPTFANILISN